jgi:hypothetical protein
MCGQTRHLSDPKFVVFKEKAILLYLTKNVLFSGFGAIDFMREGTPSRYPTLFKSFICTVLYGNFMMKQNFPHSRFPPESNRSLKATSLDV